MTRPLRMAIQKSGRLSEQSLALLSDCDFRFPQIKDKRAIRVAASNFPLEILLVRDDDIPQFVSDSVVDLGIVGGNVVHESNFTVSTVETLNFGHCRLALAVPNSSTITNLKDLQSKKIATSYPKLTAEFLAKHQVEADIHFVSGSVEIAPSLGVADAISDLVGTGSTLIQNGLKELATVFSSQSVLISNSTLDPEVSSILDRVLFRIRSVEKGRNLKYVMFNTKRASLEKILELVKGVTSPTILGLAQKDWLAVHVVVSENEIWDLIESLKTLGAEGILVSQVDKMIS